jgi:Molydopterin dinucleotide binding domain
VHPSDGERSGVQDGGLVEIESGAGSIVMAARLTDDVKEGTVAIPHGWGHDGGWSLANSAGGANSNDLAAARDEDIERLHDSESGVAVARVLLHSGSFKTSYPGYPADQLR